MTVFEFSSESLDTLALRDSVADRQCGGYASFEGWVRDFNDGRPVERLEYEAFVALAVKEGERIVREAIERFRVQHARCVHRVGRLELGELAVWVGVSAAHRAEAFAACRYIIDEVKHRVPIWKKEFYRDGDSGWVNCERCAAPSDSHAHAHHHHDAHHAHAHAAKAETASSAPHVHPTGLPAPDYSRQMVLREIGPGGQARLRGAKVLVIGAGGLGVPVLSYLAGAGIGTIGIMDADTLDASNLHRQTIYALADTGHPKALLAADRLRAQNPEVDVRPYVERASADNLPLIVGGYDVLVDCSDNFRTRFIVNDVAVSSRKPAVLASVYQYEGQLQVVLPDSACLRCVWPDGARDGAVGNCAEAGVVGPVPGVLGSLQALEVLKLLLDIPSPASRGVLLVDLMTLETRHLKAQRAGECATDCARLGRTDTLDVTVDVELPDIRYTVVDVRDAPERESNPLGFEAVTLPLADLIADSSGLPVGPRYLCVCTRGIRSDTAARTLRDRGHTDSVSLRGGLTGRR
jgi:sulfur-carrier protein adenylyltransferase/sulfurtransferase